MLARSACRPINYPSPQEPLSSDILTSVSLTGTNHAEDQPIHLRLPPGAEARSKHVKTNVEEYAGLLGRACPAAVYEYVDDEGADGTEEKGGYGGKKFVINSQVSIVFSAYIARRALKRRRIVSIASFATSKSLRKTLPGLYRKEAAGQNTVSSLCQIIDRVMANDNASFDLT